MESRGTRRISQSRMSWEMISTSGLLYKGACKLARFDFNVSRGAAIFPS